MEPSPALAGLSALNAVPTRIQGPHLLHDLVSPSSNNDFPAIDFLSSRGDRLNVSYSMLHAASDLLAAHISESLGSVWSTSSEEPLVIPVLAPQSPELYIALLAILKAGGAFCPLNLDAPPDRVRFILKDVNARIILASSDLVRKIPTDNDAYKVLSIDSSLEILLEETSSSVSHREAREDDLAYVMYTSGSTGTPKGVGISHLAATQALLAHDRHVPPFKRFLQFAAPTFDVSVFEIFFPLFRGKTLACSSRAEMLTDLPTVMRKLDVDACELTPSVAGSLLKTRANAPCLRLLLTIGEMLTEPVIGEFGGNQNQDSMLWGMYGPTEATIHCTLQPAFLIDSGKTNIGIPLDTVSAFVIDIPADGNDVFEFKPIPVGQTGELAVGGYQLATGYINRPEQTATAFINTPWGRVYRTGDKAKMRPGGNIECLGRIDDGQIKLNGQRLELGEVEHALLRTPGCHSAFATVIANTLVAFAAVDYITDVQEQILAECKAWLPAFMIPAEIRIVESFPRLPSGKIDRRQLIREYEELAVTTIQDIRDQFEDDLERQLCELASQLLSHHITPSTRLSSARLDSLAAIEYASALRVLDIVISPLDILGTATPRDLARAIRDMKTSVSLSSSPKEHRDVHIRQYSLDFSFLEDSVKVQCDKIERAEKCTALQEAMVAETLKDPRLYVNQVELYVSANITADVIKSWLFTIAQRNEILRTGFAYHDHGLCQIIWKKLGDDQVSIVTKYGFREYKKPQTFLHRPLRVEIRPSGSSGSHHSVMLTLHHSIYDGWTIDLLIEDLSRLVSGDQPVDRPQFQRISHHLGEASGSEMLAAKEFWAEQLRGSHSAVVPNFKTSAVPLPKIVTICKRIQVDPKALEDIMFQSSVGPQVIFQACLAWLWGAINGVEDVTFGSVSSGRTLPVAGIEKIMGPCVATLPLRVNLRRSRTIGDFLQSIHSTNREALRHAGLSLADIKRAAGLPIASKLFDLIFAYQETLISRRKESSAIIEAGHKDAVEAKLLVEVQPLEGHYVCQITWHTDSFSKAQVNIFSGQLESLINYFVSHPDATLECITRCFPVKCLSRYNIEPRCIKTLASLSDLVETTASRYPSNAALCFASSIGTSGMDSQILTYHTLNSRANQIARYLQRAGAMPGDTIALVLDKSPLLYCCILGILKAGCAYLPMLPSTPLQRIWLILKQAQPRLCLVDNASPFPVADVTPRGVINIAIAGLSALSGVDLGVEGDSSRLAYIIYTSGTTGAPKGVSVSNKNILSNIKVLSHIYPHRTSDRMLQACSQAFDVSVFEIFFAWGNGMCLCSATNDTLFEDFEGAVRALQVTHLSMTVTVASLLNPWNIPNVKFLVTSGEPMTDEVLEKWSEYLYQGYGPSETTNICTVRKVTKGDSSQFLGHSFENTSTFVFYPESMDLVPLGCVGELCFGGDQVVPGYLNMPDATAAKFFQHPDYGRIYRSGDLGRMLPDGSLIILGRLDNQVKLRGLRIELQEIQTIVLRSGLARTCASVLITRANSNNQQLALFYVPVGHESTKFGFLPLVDPIKQAIVILHQTLQAALPDYMVPTFIFPVSTLPLTASGKVDSASLRRSVDDVPDDTLNACSSSHESLEESSQWTWTETMIANTLADVLHVDREVIGRWNSFATIGLDSISAMPLARKLQAVLQKRIPLSLILQNPSIERLATAISEQDVTIEEQSQEGNMLPELLVEAVRKRFTSQGTSVAKVLPCTSLQEAMLTSSPLSKGAKYSYSNQMLFRLLVPSSIMMEYWSAMFQRHEILRTCFMTTDNVRYPTVQVVLGSYLPTWHTFEADAELLSQPASEHMSTFSVTADNLEPPVSLAIIHTKDAGEYLSFVCHHALYDGISIRTLLSEIEAIHQRRELPPPLSFDAFLREILKSPPGEDEFWEKLFTGFIPPRLRDEGVKDNSAQTVVSTKASSVSFTSIESQLRELGISLLSICQTAWAITLSLLHRRDDICFGNVISGRSIELEGVDTLVAPCFNTVPMRVDLSRSGLLIDVMKRLQALNVEMIPYQFTSLRRIHSRLSPHSHLFNTIFILQPNSEPLDEQIWLLEGEEGIMDVPIVCEIIPSRKDNILTAQLHRDPSLFSHKTILLIQDIFLYVFDICLKQPLSQVLTPATLPSHWQEQVSQLYSEVLQEETPTPSLLVTDKEDWSPTEIQVRAVLSKLANVHEQAVGRHTPIYRYGLDSIASVQLATLLRREDLSVTAIDVIENPTCAGIAACIMRGEDDNESFIYDFDGFRRQVSGDLAQIESLPANLEDVLPCTPTQEGMISQFLVSEGRYYFNYASWILNPELDLQQLDSSWARLVAHHQILRTGFVPVSHRDSSFAMVVHSEEDFPAPVTFRHSSTFDENRWRTRSAESALHMLSQPPWQVAIVTDRSEGSAGRTMHLAIHHALYDAFSLRSLLNDLAVMIFHEEPKVSSCIRPALSHFFNLDLSLQAAEDFWKSEAKGLVVNKFPIMTPVQVGSHTIYTASKSCSMPPGVLRQCAAEADVTVQAVLQAAWTRVLSAYLGEASVTFGIVLDGRTTEDAMNALFPMVTTIPILARNFASNTELLKHMTQYNSRIRRHEHTPLPRIQQWLGRPEGQLFDTILVYQTTHQDPKYSPWTVLDEIGSVEYAISLEVEESPSRPIHLNLIFDTAILPVEQAHIVLAQFDALIGDLLRPGGLDKGLIATNPDIFSILPPEFQELPVNASLLHQLVEHTAQRIPKTVALEFVDEIDGTVKSRQWTYSELDDMGNRVANMIISRNITPGSIIATCFNKCPEAYFTILGVLKAGCTFLSLDPSAPISRQEFILTDSKAAVLLVEGIIDIERYRNTTTPVQVVSKATIESFPVEPRSPSRPIYPSDTCYCLYTSGTTGTPKGCLITHDNAVQAMAAFEQLFSGHWDTESRWLQFASFHFDVSVLEQYWSWYVGITLVAAPKDLILSDLATVISRLEITHIDLTPSLARLIHPDEVPSLCRGVFITGGEQLRQDILHTWGPERVIYNAYGPTEATIGVTMRQRVPSNGRPANIGKPFPNVGAYIFEPGTETPVLRGGVGELCVSGRLVGKGYLNRDKLTEERFPILEQYGERVYRTGDLVRLLYDDSFDFLGRADDQVKLRGQRLEIGEINHAIKDGLLGQIADVATLVTRRDKQDKDLLVSFVVPNFRQSSAVDLQVFYDEDYLEISRVAHDACKGRLPGYMVPTYTLCVPFIPLSANNKADINRLKQLFASLSQENLQTLATGPLTVSRALNEKEQLITQALSHIVPIKEYDVAPSSTIFQLGIDSITALRLARELRSLGFTSATPSLILRNSQISQLAQALSQMDMNTSFGQVLQIKQSIHALYHKYIGMVCRVLDVDKTDVEYIAPCTPLQEGIIARSRALGHISAYFNQFVFDLDPSVSLSRLKACFDRGITASTVLGTAFLETSDGYIQAALKTQAIRWSHIEIDSVPVEELIADRRQHWIQANKTVLRYPIEVDHFECSGKHTLVLRLFHGVYDAYSFELMLRNINTVYNGGLPTYGPEFVDILPHGPLLNHHQSRPFWESLLKDHLYQSMPCLASNSCVSNSIVSRVIHIDGLEERRKALGVTHQTALQAAWLVTLRQHFTVSPTIGVIFSGRSIVVDGIDQVIGPMFNTLPFRADDTNDTTWTSLIRSVHEYNTAVLAFVHTPLRDIQKWCSKGRPLFDTLFTFDREDFFAAEEKGPLKSPLSSTEDLDYPLALEVVLMREGKLKVSAAARSGIADEDAIELLLDDFTESLRSLATSENNTHIPRRCEIHCVETVTPVSSVTSDTRLTVPSIPDTGNTTFMWSRAARQIRHEIASVAGVGDEDISEATNLFELGLDSIDVIKLVSRLTRLGFQVSASDLMRMPSIESIMLSDGIDNSNIGSPSPSSTRLKDSISLLEGYLARSKMDFQAIETILPPTPLQDSLVVDMVLSNFHRYFNHNVLEILPETDLDRLKSAWSTVYSNSPILRTTFVEIDDPRVDTAYCQIVGKRRLEFGPTMGICNLDDVATIIERARERAATGRGTSNLFQLSIATMADRKFLILSIAHALYDGWSLDMLHRDVQAAYESRYSARGQYTPYLSHLISSSSLKCERFWSDFLHGARPTLLKQIQKLPDITTISTHRSERVSELGYSDIKSLCKNYRITPQVLGQGCWAAVLALLSKSLDVTFGVVLSGRESDEAQGLLFPTMNTVPLRVIHHWNITDYLKYLQDIMSNVLEFQHMPLRRAQRLARVQGDQLFNTLFILQNAKEDPEDSKPLVNSIHESSAVEYPICVEMELTDKSVVWRIACDESYASLQDTERILDHLEVVLHHFAQRPKAEVLDFDSISGKVSICGLDPIELSNSPPVTMESKSNGLAPSLSKHSVAEGPLIQILSELSGMDRDAINLEQSIFHLGLDSISAIKASSMLRKRGMNASVRDLLQAPSIGHILDQLDTSMGPLNTNSPEISTRPDSVLDDIDTTHVVERSGLELDSVENILPALPMQVYMLSTWQNTQGAVFFSKFTYNISGQISHQELLKAWISLVDEIPILRTIFVATGSSVTPFIQIVAKPGLPRKSIVKMSTESEDGQREFVFAATPFAFVRIVGNGPGELHLHLQIHHAIYDGVSLPIIMQRLTALSTLSPTPASLSRHNAWHNFVLDHYAPQIQPKKEKFWTSYLQGGKRASFLENQGEASISHRHLVSELQRNVFDNTARLKNLCSEHGITIQALFFAAYSHVLARLRNPQHTEPPSNIDNVVFGIYLANRSNSPDLEEAPLPTLNILPLKVIDPLQKTIVTLAAEIQKDLFDISAFEHSAASLWEIHQWTGIRIDTVVNFLSLPESSAVETDSISIRELLEEGSPPARSATDVSSYLAHPEAEILLPNTVRESYVDAVDIEVSVHSGCMDIGVFCPSPHFSSSQAQGLIKEIVSTLGSL
ncbi:amino acid adenylation domain-containing protein [Biscogniauxia marginata]|nr:amino acid adenylation domain-containing protein [Biscogniauxia marginata]